MKKKILKPMPKVMPSDNDGDEASVAMSPNTGVGKSNPMGTNKKKALTGFAAVVAKSKLAKTSA